MFILHKDDRASESMVELLRENGVDINQKLTFKQAEITKEIVYRLRLKCSLKALYIKEFDTDVIKASYFEFPLFESERYDFEIRFDNENKVFTIGDNLYSFANKYLSKYGVANSNIVVNTLSQLRYKLDSEHFLNLKHSILDEFTNYFVDNNFMVFLL